MQGYVQVTEENYINYTAVLKLLKKAVRILQGYVQDDTSDIRLTPEQAQQIKSHFREGGSVKLAGKAVY